MSNNPADLAPAPWWERGVLYQIYPRSFQDSDGDGVGDLAGIERRLDYFVDLGVDAIWLSPIFPSPMADFGYDVSDYVGVDPLFGSLEDFDRLLAATHRRGLKLLLDLVPNHSSDRHAWFIESRSSRDNPKRDWYIWRDPGPDGGPPNNWISDFGGSSWEWDETTGQYYLHAFLKEQPDLNWRNPEVRAAMLDVMRFWFDRGVDGFRIDVLWHMVKAEDLRDNPPNPDYRPGMGDMNRVLQLHSTDQPEVHEIAAEMRSLADQFGERLLVGEIYLPVERLVRYYGVDAPGVHLPFNFQLIDLQWNAAAIGEAIQRYEEALPAGGWPNWVLGNHDRPRIAAKVGEAQARVAAVLLLTLRGTPTIYYGDEIGLADVSIPANEVKDPRELREPGIGLGRDPVRTPMGWDGSPHAGFTSGKPWLPLHVDWPRRNVEAEIANPGSMLGLYRALLALRRSETALSEGGFELVNSQDDVLAYRRSQGDTCIFVALNLSGERRAITLPSGELLLSTIDHGESDGSLRPNEGIILRMAD
ncbi:alpha-amylase family glycosyl hydrolase [Sphingomonas sp. NSE70-1]|uniref:Alpha-amylase family glycosyl hydrolase n=1 Tax=Sphingomonas caseinilyticus TaxID=2908205 RepID=A0ABT0RSQ9_9SPHN|nr:alpha-amylase family glycosyl hydrolase [Sphingomonas caseinilyticus]MCL6698045.1 alpha-amylase family glycosyl hydrolase [Sphingomonas caseinilyticus]